MDSIGWEHPEFIPYILSAAIIVFLAYALLAVRRNIILSHRSKKNIGKVYSTVRLLAFAVIVALIGICLGLLIAKPYTKIGIPHTEYEPIDIVLVEDRSLSMLAQATDDPCGPSRFDIERQEILRFIDSLEVLGADRVGLVVFSRFGARVIPVPTKDYRLFRRIYGEIGPDEILSNTLVGGTNHWHAVIEAIKVFDLESPYRRILIIVTDGETEAPQKAIDKHKPKALEALDGLDRVSVYILGIGDPSRAYPIPTGRNESGCPVDFFIQEDGEEDGQTVLTMPDVQQLEKLSVQLGARYKHSTTGQGLTELVADAVAQERVPIGEKTVYAYHDLSDYLIYLCLFFLVLCVILKSP